MNSSKFTWEKYCCKVGYSLAECWDATTNLPAKGFVEIGRCKASSLLVRSRLHGDAVMLRNEENGDEFWLHYYTQKEYLANLQAEQEEEQ